MSSMLSKFADKVADPRREDSLGSQMRRKRFALFRALIATVPRPINILDVGGEIQFWRNMHFAQEPDVTFTLINRAEKTRESFPQFTSVEGDARHMPQYADKSFDIVFSNSVIEHVGTLADQTQMAQEIQRIGQRYFIQTPNRYFPIEPHFLFPLFQFLPLSMRVFLVSHFALGAHSKRLDTAGALQRVSEIRLLSLRELRTMFPGAKVYREKVLWLTKSFILYGGWDAEKTRYRGHMNQQECSALLRIFLAR